jgi:hypothetical protein
MNLVGGSGVSEGVMVGSLVESLTRRPGHGPCDPARWSRAELWAVFFDLKIAARRCALHEPHWAAQVTGRVQAACGRLLLARHA